MDLTPIEMHALKIVGAKKALVEGRDTLTVGERRVDFTVRVSGKVKVAPDAFIKTEAALDKEMLLAALLDDVANGNVTKAQARDGAQLLLDLQARIVRMDEAQRLKLQIPIDTAGKLYKIQEKDNVKPVPRRGSVSGDLVFTKIAPEQAEQAEQVEQVE
jgi:hypothetical protein